LKLEDGKMKTRGKEKREIESGNERQLGIRDEIDLKPLPRFSCPNE